MINLKTLVRAQMAVMAAFSGVAVQAASNSGDQPHSVALTEAAKQAQARGALMYSYDQAAWHATDKFQEDLKLGQVSLDSNAAQGLEGYVVEPDGDKLLVTFYRNTSEGLTAFARYRMSGSDVVSGGLVPADGDSVLSPLAQRMIAARRTAVAEMAKPGHGLCTRSNPNTLILAPDATHDLSVYVLSSTTAWDHYPAGGHYRFDFGDDGKLLRERAFMKSCIDLNTEPKDGKRPELVGVSHLLDNGPTEIHAFVSYYVNAPLMVITTQNGWLWGVTKGKVQSLGPVPEK